MKKPHSVTLAVRILSLVTLTFAPLGHLLRCGSLDAGSICIALFEMAVILDLSPVGSEWKELCETEAFFCSFVFLVLAALDLGAVAAVIAASVLMVGSIAVKTARKYSRIRILFVQNAPMNELHDNSKLSYMLATQLLGLVLCAVCPFPPVLIAYAVVLAFFAALMYYKSYSGKSLLMTGPRERMLRELIKGSMKESTRRLADEDAKMTALYSRVQTLMQEKKPYLDPRIDLGTLSGMLLTNRLYLSKTINIMSGRNFCNFINYYRVHYATDLIRRDPRLRMNEVAMMSGFTSPVSFSIAFKTMIGKSPSEYLRELKGNPKKRFQ